MRRRQAHQVVGSGAGCAQIQATGGDAVSLGAPGRRQRGGVRDLHRRHLSTSQRSLVGAKAREQYDRQAAERQRKALDSGRQTRQTQEERIVENLPESLPDTGRARDQAGQAVGVSGKTIDQATKVLKQAVPEVVRAVEQGRLSVSAAAVLADEPEDGRTGA